MTRITGLAPTKMHSPRICDSLTSYRYIHQSCRYICKVIGYILLILLWIGSQLWWRLARSASYEAGTRLVATTESLICDCSHECRSSETVAARTRRRRGGNNKQHCHKYITFVYTTAIAALLCFAMLYIYPRSGGTSRENKSLQKA